MTLSELTTRLRAALMDSAELMEGNEVSLIESALADYSRYRPQTKLATFSLMTNQLMYAAPDDLIRVRTLLYGQNQRAKQPWQHGYPQKLPRLLLAEDEQNKKWLRLSFFPADSVVAGCGRDVSYTYYGLRSIKNEVISIDKPDEPLLLLRCIAEAFACVSGQCG